MKYYKYISKGPNYAGAYKIGKIYPEDFKFAEGYLRIKSICYDYYWQEVPSSEYFLQEGKLPEDYIVECNNAQETTIVMNNNGNSNKQWRWWEYCYTNKNDTTGFRITNNIKNCPSDYPLFTFEQWNKLINKNMKEEFILPRKWAVKRTPKNANVLNNWANSQPDVIGTSYNDGWIHSINYGLMGHSNSGHYYADYIKHPGHTEITFEQFEKYVLKKEDMKKIIGYKLKEDCKQYEKAAEKIADFANPCNTDGYFSSWMEDTPDGGFVNRLRKAGVLELWFEPVYKEEALKFGGYDVTFEKVHSGVRITCNNKIGTFSQIEKIYTTALKEENMMFGSQKVKQIDYSDGSYWSSESLKAKPTSIKIGCTTGTWKEFTAIYEKAKSMV